jgi:ribonuclease BN (tRNA processing enzyme)
VDDPAVDDPAVDDRDARSVTLFDCGPGTLRSLANAGHTVDDVVRVVLTHEHPDHWLDLLALAFARRNPGFAGGALEIVGPRGTAGLLERAAAIHGERGWLAFDDVALCEVDPAAQGRAARIERDGLELAWTATGHTPSALAWRVTCAASGAALAYSGDSGEVPALGALARAADVLVCECSFPDERAVPHHLTPGGVGRLAAAARVRRLVLTHFYPEMDPVAARARCAELYDGPIEAARDGTRIAVRAPDKPARL